jgi:hypothetical protein
LLWTLPLVFMEKYCYGVYKFIFHEKIWLWNIALMFSWEFICFMDYTTHFLCTNVIMESACENIFVGNIVNIL